MPELRPVRIANCSGFYGDRLSAAKEMVEGGPIDVLSGDWLAELTMLILVRERMKDPKAGYAKTFLKQLEQVLGTCLERGIKIVSNAGGVNPHAMADAVRAAAAAAGLSPRIAVVAGDDVMDRLGGWNDQGVLRHLESGQPLQPTDGMAMAANAYLGAWGVTEALKRGADIVITGRVTDAALVVGPAAWWHDWATDDWDALAGALVAGHVIECGTQATGGNYSRFEEVGSFHEVGFPLAEIARDGSCVITKHEGTGGRVNAGTVTAQLLYEIGGASYFSPDVIARFDTIQLTDLGDDRVQISGVRGLSPTPNLKAGVLLAAGFRNEATFVLGGDRITEKTALLDDVFWKSVGGKARFMEARTDVLRADLSPDVPVWLRLSRVVVSAKHVDPGELGRNFTNKAIELMLSTIPGITLEDLPGSPRPCGVFWPTLVPRDEVTVSVLIDGETVTVPHPPLKATPFDAPADTTPAAPAGPTIRGPLGRLALSRSGDKAGNANVGFWVTDPAAFRWLVATVNEPALRGWLSGFDGEIRIHALPNLLAINVELIGWLGRGVAENLKPDSQAKCLAEALRTAEVEIPVALL